MNGSIRLLTKTLLAITLMVVVVSGIGVKWVGFVEDNLMAPTSLAVSNTQLAVLEPYAGQLKVFTVDGVILRQIHVQGRARSLQNLSESVYLFCDELEKKVIAVDIDQERQYDYFEGCFDFTEPVDVLVDRPEIYVLDAGRQEVVVFDQDRQLIKTVPIRSHSGEPLGYPSSFAYDQDSAAFYILDQLSSKVTIVGRDGVPRGSFGSFGDREDQITRAGAVLCGPDRTVLVTDRFQNRIVVYTSEGDFVMDIDLYDTGLPGFALPTGMTIDSDGILYVASTEGAGIGVFLLETASSATEAIRIEQAYPRAFDTLAAGRVKLVARVEPGDSAERVVGVDFQLYQGAGREALVGEAIGVVPDQAQEPGAGSSDIIAQWQPEEALPGGETYSWRTRVHGRGFSGEWTELRLFFTAAVPASFQLEQNYPNPFNPETHIAFTVPVESDVRIDIYNLLGRKVRTLRDESLPAGRHELIWDGSTDSGRPAASGVYFYRLTAGGFTETKKMVFLK